MANACCRPELVANRRELLRPLGPLRPAATQLLDGVVQNPTSALPVNPSVLHESEFLTAQFEWLLLCSATSLFPVAGPTVRYVEEVTMGHLAQSVLVLGPCPHPEILATVPV